MEIIDDDIADRSAAFIEAQHKAGKPAFVWVNFTHMHFRTHVKPKSVEQYASNSSPTLRSGFCRWGLFLGQVLQITVTIGHADRADMVPLRE